MPIFIIIMSDRPRNKTFPQGEFVGHLSELAEYLTERNAGRDPEAGDYFFAAYPDGTPVSREDLFAAHSGCTP